MSDSNYPEMKHPGLFTMLGLVMKGPFRVWMKLILPFSIIFTGVFFWSLYEFIIADEAVGLIRYGVIVILTGLVLAMYKLWFWLEMQKIALFIALTNQEDS